MLVPKFNVDVNDAAAVRKVMDSLEPQQIACNNWPERSTYTPEVSFRMFHTGKYMVLRYDVREECTAAAAAKDHDHVWEDSCVECFLSTDNGGHYYNFECACNGKMHLAYRVSGEHGAFAPQEALDLIRRYPSLGDKPFVEFTGDNVWHITLVFPIEALYEDKLESWDGLHTTMNLYKCGDKLSKPHYLSWAPITSGKVSFHQAAFFQPVDFE